MTEPPSPRRVGFVTYHPEVIQGTDEWLALRRGILTASEMKLIVTPTLKIASNDKERAHLYELLAQRVTGYVEPHYVSDDMLRGQADEIEARDLYAANFAPVEEIGFITNDRHGVTIGYSPDGLVGDDGQIECKSRRQKYQAETLLEHVPHNTIPAEFLLQVQTGLIVSERAWCDFVSYCAGMPMAVIRVYPDPKVHAAILGAAIEFEERLLLKLAAYETLRTIGARLLPTERRIEQDIMLA